jgi:shikimate dehydrogenase
MRVFGLIGYPLSHSFSADYFNSKFRLLGLDDHIYKLFPIKNIAEIRNLLKSEPGLTGLNVTIPYKETVIPFLDKISPEAQHIGAINCILQSEGKLYGYNTDCFGFENAYLKNIVIASSPVLILGNGGASKAVQYVLKKHHIRFLVVSRTKSDHTISYQDVTDQIIAGHKVIINTTSLGMFPETAGYPPLSYQHLAVQHILIDLIYNPELTEFMKYGLLKGCKVLNGLTMLQYQADKSWEIWK